MPCSPRLALIVLWGILTLLPTPLSFAKDYPPWRLGIATQTVAAGFELKPIHSNTPTLKYRPAESHYFGIILGYRWVGTTIYFAVPAEREVRNAEGTSRYRDYRISSYWHQVGIELSYNRYLGYLLENSSSEISASTLQGASFLRFPDIETVGWGGSILWSADPSHYSLSGAIDQSSFQDHSGGAMVLIGMFRSQIIQSNSPWIPAEKRSSFGNDASLRKIRTFAIASGPGYGYFFRLGDFFIAPLLSVSVGLRQSHYWNSGGEYNRDGLGANIHARLGLGWNSDRFFLKANLYFDTTSQDVPTVAVSSNISGATVAVGSRF